VLILATPPRIEPARQEQLEALLPLIAAYQRFYQVEEIDPERNRIFFERFLAPSEEGILLGAWEGERPLGHACLYWTFSSLIPAEIVLLNDLYVVEEVRGKGVGRALIEAAAEVARGRGAHHLEWFTAPDNTVARRLYDSTGAQREDWISYDLDL